MDVLHYKFKQFLAFSFFAGVCYLAQTHKNLANRLIYSNPPEARRLSAGSMQVDTCPCRRNFRGTIVVYPS